VVRNKFISGVLSALVSLNFCTYAHAQEHFRLHFARNESEFFNTLLDNEKTLDSLQKWVKNTTPERILSIDVSVFASPEGPKEFNEQLCRNRAEEFNTAVLPYFKGAEDKVNIHIGGEAWEELRMRVANDKKLRPEYIEQILSILDDKSIDNETRKQHIATRISEHNYRFLLWEHYRLLRYYDIFITVKPEQTEKAIERVELESTEEKPVNEVETEVEAPVIEEKEEKVEERETKQERAFMAISTNLPYDITYIPGYGITSIPSFTLEIMPGNSRWTLGADVEWPMWQHPETHRYFQINNITLWTRRYFRSRQEPRKKGWYLMGNINAARYGIGFNANKGWEGEGIGASLGGGYRLPLGKYFFLDMGIAAGAFYSAYDPYVWGNDGSNWYYYDYNGNPEAFVRRNQRLWWVGPTRVWLSIGFDFWKKDRRTK
jgi:hypothetical protein